MIPGFLKLPYLLTSFHRLFSNYSLTFIIAKFNGNDLKIYIDSPKMELEKGTIDLIGDYLKDFIKFIIHKVFIK